MADASIKVTTSTQITHIGSGALIAAGAFSGSADISTALSGTGNMARYPRADVALMIAATQSIATTSQTIYLYRRDLNFDGTNDQGIPGTSNRAKFVGAFTVPAATTASTTNYMVITDVDVGAPNDVEFYIENGLGVNVLAGWTLKVTPKTDVGATA